jgi:hypothetical protein
VLTSAIALVASVLTVLSGTGVAEAAEVYRLNCAEQPYSYKQTNYANGSVVRRHELRAGDMSPRDSKYTDGRQRCEMVGQTDYAFGKTIWFSYGFRWTGSMPGKFAVMTQFHASPEAGETIGKPPAFGMGHRDGKFRIATKSDTRVNTTSKVASVIRYTRPWFTEGVWYNLVGRVTFDPFGKGNVTFWIDGKQVYSSGSIPLGYNDTVGPHFSHGQYRGKSDATTAYEFANVEVGTTSLLDRVSNPKPLPN